jgi:hypothetical protein
MELHVDNRKVPHPILVFESLFNGWKDTQVQKLILSVMRVWISKMKLLYVASVYAFSVLKIAQARR